MFTIGLTGNIGSGKSTVSRYLQSIGAIIIDADQVARDIVQPDTPALAEIARFFGPDILDDAGALNRQAMGTLVFTNPEALATLNKITHPRIVEAIKTEKRVYYDLPPAQRPKLLVIDAPLLVEVGLDKAVDEVWAVHVEPQQQIERLIHRDGMSEKEARRRVAAQMPQEEKLKYAHRRIDNSGAPAQTIEQVTCFLADLNKMHDQTTE